MNYYELTSTIAYVFFFLIMIIFIVGLGIKSYILYLDKKLDKTVKNEQTNKSE